MIYWQKENIFSIEKAKINDNATACITVNVVIFAGDNFAKILAIHFSFGEFFTILLFSFI